MSVPAGRNPPRPVVMQSLERRTLLSSYFVSPSGSDSGPGTSAAPWKTLQHAADNVVAGDTVTVRSGAYTGFVLGWDGPQNGTANAPITFKADPGATVSARNNKTADGINLEGADYVIVDGFTVIPASGQDAWRAGIRSVQNSHAILRNNTVQMRTNDRYGIFSSFTDHLLVADNNVSGTNNSGIYTSNSAVNPTIRGNTVHHVGGNGLHFNGDISQGGSGVITGALVERNVVYDAGGAVGGSAINMDGVQDSTIQNNLLYDNHAKGIALYQIDAAEGSTRNLVRHNTVVQADDATGYALTIKDASTGNQVFNNILLSLNTFNGAINLSTDSESGFVSDYNIVTDRLSTTDGDSFMSLPNWRGQTSQDAHSKSADPASLFADLTGRDLRLKSGSIAIDAADAKHAVGSDITGAVRPFGSGYDIGAYEFAAVSNVKPPAPSAVKARSAGATSVALAWIDNAINESGYLIRAKPGPRGAWFTVARRGVNATSFTVKNLISGLKYYFIVRAFNAAGSSAYAPMTSATPKLAKPADIASVAKLIF